MKKNSKNSLVLIAFSISLVLFQLSSCKTAHMPSSNPAAYSIEGLWIGTAITTGSDLSPQYFSLIVKPGGKIIADTKTEGDKASQYLSAGTWTLNGTSFTYTTTNIYGNTTISYIGQVQNGTGTFSASAGTITNGTWNNPSPASAGTFTLTKVK